MCFFEEDLLSEYNLFTLMNIVFLEFRFKSNNLFS